MSVYDKQTLLAALLDRIQSDLDSLIRTQDDTREAATHEENRAEHAKDTRATEQSYLARGLAGRVEALRRGQALLEALELRSFEADDAIALTAIVRIAEEQTGTEQGWWLVPAGGGIEIATENGLLRTLTPAAPLGQALLGLQIGDEAAFMTPGGERGFEVLEVS